MTITTTIRCPACAHESREEIPESSCVIVHSCADCGLEIRPKRGDCCVFCSYGADPCPTAPGSRCRGQKR